MAGASEIASSFTGFTRLSKGLVTLLVLGYVIAQLVPMSIDYLALIPGKTIPFAWNVFTAGYLEQSFLGLLSSILGVLYFGKLLEPIWGPRGFIKFIAFVNFFTSLNTFVISIFLYVVTQQGDYVYAPISGFSGVVAGFLVALKQLMPEHLFFGVKLRAKWLPSLFVTAAAIVGLLVPSAVLFVPYITLGTYTSWLYLRYFQPRAEAPNFTGDPSEEFAFATFFPPFMRPVVHPVAVVFSKLFCGRRLQAAMVDLEDGEGTGDRPLPGSDPVEASRRRERGARALEERLGVPDVHSKAEDSV